MSDPLIPEESALSEGPPTEVKRRIGPYLLTRQLGVGGMGEVYQAYDERLERWVALKHILPEAAEDENAWERLRREAQAVASLNHPSIVRIHDILDSEDGDWEDGDWIVMELVEGKTLLDLINDDALTLIEAVRVCQEVAEGLAAAHTQGMIHRDLKAENVMVTPEGSAKILDFGLAKKIFTESESGALSSMSQHGWIQGTGRAMSPEQVNGKQLDHRSDLFSLGTLLFEALTGHSPFLDAKGFVQTLMRVCQHQQPSARSLNTRVPAELAALIDLLLEKNPDQRPQKTAEVAQNLRRIVEEMEQVPEAVRAPREKTGQLQEVQLTSTRIAMPRLRSPTESYGTDGPDSEGPDSEGSIAERLDDSLDDTSEALQTLMRLHLGDRSRIAQELGEYRSFLFFARHDRLVRELLPHHHGVEIKKTDIFILLFAHPADAVLYAIDYRKTLTDLCAEEEIMTDFGLAIHLGHISKKEDAESGVMLGVGVQPLEVEQNSDLLLERFSQAAAGGRILLSREAKEIAQETFNEEEPSPQLFWESHGLRHLPDLEVTQVYEVSDRKIAPMGIDAEELQDVRRFVLRRRALMTATAALLASCFALLWFVVFPNLSQSNIAQEKNAAEAADTLVRSSQIELRDAVAVIGFVNLSEKSEDVWISTALSELISTELAIGEEVRMISGENVARMKAELPLKEAEEYSTETLGAIRKNINADYVVTGSYEVTTEGELSLSLKIQKTESGLTISEKFTDRGDEIDFLDVVSQGGTFLRETLDLESEISTEAVRAMFPIDSEASKSYASGLNFLRKYDALAARYAFEKAAAKEPDFALTHARLAEAFSELGDDARALESAKVAFDLAKKKNLPQEQALLIEGLYYEAAADWDAAVQTYQKLRDRFPDEIDYGLRLAETQIGAGLGEEALLTVEQMRGISIGRRDPRVDLTEASAARLLARYGQMEKVLLHAIDLGKEQEASIIVAEALRELAWVYRRYGRLEDAQAALREAQDRFDRAGVRGKVGDVLYNIGINTYQSGKISEAEEVLQEALIILRETGNRKSISLTYQALGFVYRDQGDLATAVSMFQAAIEIVREVGDRRLAAYYGATLAEVFLDQGQVAKAEELAQAFLETGQLIKSPEMEGWSRRLLGSISTVVGDLDSAADHLRGSLQAGRDLQFIQMQAESLTGLARVAYFRGDFEQSLSFSDQALALYQELSAEISVANEFLHRARYLTALERPDEALRNLEQSRDIYTRRQFSEGISAADFRQATTYLQMGQLSDARLSLDKALAYAMDSSQRPFFRIATEILNARLLAQEKRFDKAFLQLDSVTKDLQEFWIMELDLEVLLAKVDILYQSESLEGAATEKRKLVRSAESEGFGAFAEKARRLHPDP